MTWIFRQKMYIVSIIQKIFKCLIFYIATLFRQMLSHYIALAVFKLSVSRLVSNLDIDS